MIYHEKREDGKKIVARCENFLTYHNKLFQFLQDKVSPFVNDLLGEESVIFKEKINFKKSGGKGYTPHQDAPAFVKFGHKYHMSVLLPGDEMTQENGCIEISPGKYLNEMIEHPGGSIHQKYMKELESQKLYAIMKPGDLLAFDSYVPHWSADNKSEKRRRACILTYNCKSEGSYRGSYYQDKRENFPPDIERVPGRDYSAGAEIYNVANPITVKTESKLN